ncbi:MAG: hypothetical protein EYC70_01750 [Planctomycetota bacterium]|nr:MAG: hypothetical protein EYC70_01750 [Planctomycetota bacterium]
MILLLLFQVQAAGGGSEWVVRHRFDTPNGYDGLGYSVAPAEDVNADGFPDLIYGAPLWGRHEHGRATVRSGADGSVLLDWQGSAGAGYLGRSVAGAGDVDGDGFADLIIGAPGDEAAGTLSLASVRVYSGRNGRPLYFYSGGAEHESLGWSVSGLGDVDGDGVPDFAMGAPYADPAGRADAGAAFVVSGADGRKLLALNGFAAGDEFGFAVAAAGDVDQDGHADLLVGAPDADVAGFADSGSVFLFSGRNGSLLARFDGQDDGDHFGWSVAGAGDVNGDAVPDLLAGAPHDDVFVGEDTGSATLFSGATGAPLWRLFGLRPQERFGTSVAGAGDVDGDGWRDLVVGAPGDHSCRGVLVYSGRDLRLLGAFGEYVRDYAYGIGAAVASAGDVDRDGRDEVFAGAPASATDYSSNGSAYVFDLEPAVAAPPQRPFAQGGLHERVRIVPDERAGIGEALAAAGDVNGDGCADIVAGANAASNVAYLYAGRDGAQIGIFLGELDEDGLHGDYGAAVAGLGDVDGDHVPDLAIAAPRWSQWIAFDLVQVGAVFVHSGGDGSLLYRIGGGGSINGLGTSLENAGDWDGDGVADLLAGAPRHARGSTLGHALIYSGAGGHELLRIGGAYDFGSAVAATGDINGDGVSELLVGAPNAPSGSFPYSGAAMLYSGADGALLMRFAEPGMRMYGQALAGAGDVDGDGAGDFIVGAPGAAFQPGVVFLYSGRSGALLQRLEGTSYDRSYFGYSMDGTGDMDEDGVPDFAIGSLYDGPGIGGGVYLYSGRERRLLDHVRGGKLDLLGHAVAGLGDTDADGRPNLAAGSPSVDHGLCLGAGAVFVYGYDPYLTLDSDTLSAGGGAVTASLDFPPSEAGQRYRLLASFTGSGPITVDGIEVPLSADALLRRTASGWSPLFQDGTGQLDAGGDATVTLLPSPKLADYAGTTLYLAAVSLHPLAHQLRGSSAARTLLLVP